jgi:hypothetical protein
MKEEDQMPVLITWFITLFFRPGPPLVARRTHDPLLIPVILAFD